MRTSSRSLQTASVGQPRPRYDGPETAFSAELAYPFVPADQFRRPAGPDEVPANPSKPTRGFEPRTPSLRVKERVRSPSCRVFQCRMITLEGCDRTRTGTTACDDLVCAWCARAVSRGARWKRVVGPLRRFSECLEMRPTEAHRWPRTHDRSRGQGYACLDQLSPL
jgi:hypothetical protein